jgi:hypothetical protein
MHCTRSDLPFRRGVSGRVLIAASQPTTACRELSFVWPWQSYDNRTTACISRSRTDLQA